LRNVLLGTERQSLGPCFEKIDNSRMQKLQRRQATADEDKRLEKFKSRNNAEESPSRSLITAHRNGVLLRHRNRRRAAQILLIYDLPSSPRTGQRIMKALLDPKVFAFVAITRGKQRCILRFKRVR
jgi:hypothetical protein